MGSGSGECVCLFALCFVCMVLCVLWLFGFLVLCLGSCLFESEVVSLSRCEYVGRIYSVKQAHLCKTDFRKSI